MTSIRSFSEILSGAEPVAPAERERFIAIIHDESLRLTRLLDEILEISRLETGAIDLPLQTMDPEKAIVAALDTISGLARNNGVRVSHEPVPPGVLVRANEDRLRQVLINLLSNAINYNSAATPRIHVRAHAASGFLRIDVIDNGGGVSVEEANTVFEKFKRGSRAHNEQGAGLGLAISRALMRLMDGDLTVEFAAQDASFFSLRLVLVTQSLT